jgi:hypothetical protein
MRNRLRLEFSDGTTMAVALKDLNQAVSEVQRFIASRDLG